MWPWGRRNLDSWCPTRPHFCNNFRPKKVKDGWKWRKKSMNFYDPSVLILLIFCIYRHRITVMKNRFKPHREPQVVFMRKAHWCLGPRSSPFIVSKLYFLCLPLFSAQVLTLLSTKWLETTVKTYIGQRRYLGIKSFFNYSKKRMKTFRPKV